MNVNYLYFICYDANDAFVIKSFRVFLFKPICDVFNITELVCI